MKMKTANSIVFALCLALAAGSVAAQENQMGKDARNHDETMQNHDGMKKNAMEHDTMKTGTMSKDHMMKGTMRKGSKSGDMMKKDKTDPATSGDESSQH